MASNKTLEKLKDAMSDGGKSAEDLFNEIDTDGDGTPDGCDSSPEPEPVRGCTDSAANNYNSDAEEDDGSCTYDEPEPEPEPEPSSDTDGDGVPNNLDRCPGHDDSADSDGDGVPDGCDSVYNSDESDSESAGLPGFTFAFTIASLLGAIGFMAIRRD